MSVDPRRQTQKSGSDSVNQQAGRDVVNNYGLSVEDVKQICLMAIRAEMETITSQAAEVALQRVGDFSDVLASRLSEMEDWVLQKFTEPDLQFSLGDAQKAYARSGKPEHKRTLVELIISRAGLESGEIQATAISQAIESVRLLTGGQVRALAMCWFLSDTYNPGVVDENSLREYSESVIVPLYVEPLPTSYEVSHLAATNCAMITTESYLIERVLGRQMMPLLTRPFKIAEATPAMRENWSMLLEYGVIAPVDKNAVEDEVSYNTPIYNTNRISQVLERDAGAASLALSTIDFLRGRTVSAEDAKERLARIHPIWPDVIDHWNASFLNSMRCTYVGTVIAHSFMKEQTGQPLNLDEWIPRSS